jgi:hypothetical protein
VILRFQPNRPENGFEAEILVAHLWIRRANGWCVRKLFGPEFNLETLLAVSLPGAPSASPKSAVARLVCTGAGATRSWAILAAASTRAQICGCPVHAGLRVLNDRDEIRVAGAQYFFSAESLPALERFPYHDRPVFCGRCRQPIEAGSPAVRCPGLACQVYYHQDESAGFPCWTYAEVCNFCATPTAMDAGFVWMPEE